MNGETISESGGMAWRNGIGARKFSVMKNQRK